MPREKIDHGEFMSQCTADGKTAEACQAEWDEAHKDDSASEDKAERARQAMFGNDDGE